MLIAMALFALIGIAGFTLLDGVLRTQGATETRLARMAEIQRAMLVVSTDLDQITGELAGSADTLSLQKTNLSGEVVNVRYALDNGTLVRTVGGETGERRQVLIEDVSAVRWTFHRRRGDWLEGWPLQPEIALTTEMASPNDGSTAVALDLTLNGLDAKPGATLRRVASIPLMEPPEPVASARQ
ncbi:hypothetical protein HZ989_05315 [Brevundimonas sp. AJA228-03]|nr:hypothetical protein HZ989_05315 [Brevundimonas sp. AJA228-03]